MSISQIQKLEKERAALAKKIAQERTKYAAKIGGDIIKSVGDEHAETVAALIAATVQNRSAPALMDSLKTLAQDNAQTAGATPALKPGSRAPGDAASK